MHDVFAVQFTYGKYDLGSIELDYILWESSLFLEYLIKLTAVNKRHDKV